MEHEKLGSGLREALLSLLDDTSVPVRQALKTHFARNRKAAVGFLREAAGGTNRIVAFHARRYLDEIQFADPIAEFSEFIRSLNYELETGMLLLSRTVTPDINVGECCQKLDQLADRCRELIAEPSTGRERCRVLNRVLFHECGFHGNVENYTDPKNSFIDAVLERKTGIPISLSIIYLLVAQRIGLNLEPVGLPGHFVVGCYLDDAPFFIDTFDGGVFRTAEEVVATVRSHHVVPRPGDLMPTPVREVLCRSCRNLVNHYGAAGDRVRASLFAGFVEEFEAAYARNAT